jgi:Tfp pilus assembly protein PilF
VKDMQRVLPFFLITIFLAVLDVWYHYNQSIGDATNVHPEGFAARFAGAGWAVWFYLYKALIPLNLLLVYPRWHIDPAKWINYLPVSALLIVLGLLLRNWKTWARQFLMGFGYFVVTLFPVMGFFSIAYMQHSLVADHWQYFSIPGLIALVIGLIHHYGKSFLPINDGSRLVSIVIVCLCAFLSYNQAGTYTSEDVAWRVLLEKNPNCAAGHVNLGVWLLKNRKLDEAESHLSRAVELDPNNMSSQLNLGVLLARKHKTEQAERLFRNAVTLIHERSDKYIDAASLVAMNNMAYYIGTEQADDPPKLVEATELIEKACKLTNYKNAEYLDTLVVIYMDSGKFELAMEKIELAIQLAKQNKQENLLTQLKTRKQELEQKMLVHKT